MNINTNLTLVNRKVASNRKIDYIVIHYTGALGTAKDNSKYFKYLYRGASAHYFVDNTSIWQVVREKDIAWHIGSNKYYNNARNENSIGIEMCCYKKQDGSLDISEQVIKTTIELTKELMKKYNISSDRVVRHYDCTHKVCPAPLVKDSSRWANFKEKLIEQKHKVGQAIEINVPIGIAFDNGKKSLVDDRTNQYWVDNSVIKNSRIIARVNIAYISGTKYLVQCLNEQFWVDEKNITKPL